jgi:hypothetical protein
MKFIENLPDSKTLTPERKAKIAKLWSPTFADLKVLTRVGIALLRGQACPIEETAMAKMCNPAKTKHLGKDERGFLAFQSTLDRACGMLKDTDPHGLAHTFKSTLNAEIPRDDLIAAKSYDAMVGQTALVGAYDIIQHARTIFGLLKDKYGESLNHKGTVTLENKPKKVSKVTEISIMAELRARFANDEAVLGSELIKYSANPVAYVLPAIEVSEPVVVLPAIEVSEPVVVLPAIEVSEPVVVQVTMSAKA